MIPNIEIKPLLSSQGKILSNPDKAQVHFVKTFSDESDFFALVVNVCDEFCDVVPGCFDAMQAGPDDIFIPEEVLGEPVMLAIGSMCTIRRTAIGEGFATLNDDVYNNIISAMIKYEDGEKDLGFDRGYKYLSENDPRIEAHHRMYDGFIAAQGYAAASNLESLRIVMPRVYELAAGSETKAVQSEGFLIESDSKKRLLVLQLRGFENMVRVWISDGDVKSVSHDYDGCRIVSGGDVLCVIKDGMGEFSASGTLEFNMVRSDGERTVIPLKRMSVV